MLVQEYLIKQKNIMLNLHPKCLKVDFQQVDEQTGGKWLIHDTKRHTDNQLQSLENILVELIDVT